MTLLLLALFITLIVFTIFDYKKVAQHEYLEVLDFTDWKTVDQVKEELQKERSVWVTDFHIGYNMILLSDEGLVEFESFDDPLKESGVTVAYRRISNDDDGGRREPKIFELPRLRGFLFSKSDSLLPLKLSLLLHLFPYNKSRANHLHIYAYHL